jgi:hypothetical protein
MDLSKYADLFLTESREYLSAMNHHLLELEREPGAEEPVRAIGASDQQVDAEPRDGAGGEANGNGSAG